MTFPLHPFQAISKIAQDLTKCNLNLPQDYMMKKNDTLFLMKKEWRDLLPLEVAKLCYLWPQQQKH